LIVPLFVLAGFQVYAWQMYGLGPLTGAAAYALAKGVDGSDLAARLTTTLAFSGGTMASAFIFMAFAWPRRHLGPALGSALLIGGVLVAVIVQGRLPLFEHAPVTGGQLVQLVLFVLAGLHLLVLAASDVIRSRNGEGLLLFLWVAGVFIFAGFVNWSVNARTLLPMAPAVGILMVRRMERDAANAGHLKGRTGLWGGLLIAAAIALAVTWADYSLAESQRTAATRIRDAYPNRLQATWFQGHWGFQYYMQQYDFRPLDFRTPRVHRGDIVVTPTNNSNAKLLSRKTARTVQTMTFETCSWLTTMQVQRGAGFYAHQWGPLPFVFGPVPAETYLVYEITQGGTWPAGG
jgi:hypothetical protein